MCPTRVWFSTYEPFDGEIVLMRNNFKCKEIGIGTHNQDIVICQTCSRQNLISLGTLDENGCKYTAEGGVMKISRGSLVLMKGIKIGTLYKLEGSTTTDSDAIYSLVTADDTTRLWHMSEKGMDALSKRGLLSGRKIGKLVL